MSRISPTFLLVIVILAIGFFVFGILQLLIRCLIKRPSFSSLSRSSRLPDDVPGSHTFQRQLQHLFRLHDSGLDQSMIDALPVFYYKEIMGLKEPFDCAVCLCEFSDGDKLKFLPNCSHAFHIHCIETWLLANSTCPLCRSVIGFANPSFSLDNSSEQRMLSCPDEATANGASSSRQGVGERVFSVRLGKFRSLNDSGLQGVERKRAESTSSSCIDDRRCYSMGAFQYIVGDDNLQVTLCNGNGVCSTKTKAAMAKDRMDGNHAETSGNKINPRSKDDSFSLSKVWLWSKKGRYSGANGSSVLRGYA